jgi:hypothetical protein
MGCEYYKVHSNCSLSVATIEGRIEFDRKKKTQVYHRQVAGVVHMTVV